MIIGTHKRSKVSLMKAVVVCAAVSLSWPAQTGQNARGSHNSEITSFASLKSAPAQTRRMRAEFCSTDVEITRRLLNQGFHAVRLGENVGERSMAVTAGYGPKDYDLIADRCTGRLQAVRAVIEG